MGFLDRLGTAVRTAWPTFRYGTGPLRVRAVDPSRLPDWLAGRSADWTLWDDPERVVDAARKCAVVFACTTYLADAVCEAPLLPYRTRNGEREPAPERFAQVAADLLADPNPHMTGSEFLNLLVRTMGVVGYGVVEKVRNGAGLPAQLWPLRPDWLVRRWRVDGARYWEYRVGGIKPREIADDDVEFVPYYHDDRHERYGIGPAQVAGREVGIDSSLTDFLKVFLDAGGIPPFVLTHPDPIYDEALITAMQEKWRQKYAGSKAYGSLPILHGGYELQEIGGSIDEMAWPDLRGLTELKICMAYRVPAELVQARVTFGGGSSLTSTEMDGAMRILQRYGAGPLRTRIAAALTRGVLAEFTGGDPAYDLGFDVSQVLALQEDEDKLHTRIRADWDAGLLTLNEARVAIGEKEIPKQGDVVKVPFSTTLVPVTALIEPTPAPVVTPTPPKALPAGRRRYRDVKALSPAAIELRSATRDRAMKDRTRLTEIGSRALRKFWAEQGERIAAALTKSAGPVDVRVAQAIDWGDEERRLAEVLQRFYHANGEAAFAATSELLGIEIAWDLANPYVQQVAFNLGRRIRGIAETTRDDVARIVGDALTEGVTIEELSGRLRGLFTETYRGRAETVARTESQVAYNLGAKASYQASGEVDEVEFFDNPAHTDSYNATDGLTCAERNGLVVPLGQMDRHVYAEHPRGSLAVAPIVKEA